MLFFRCLFIIILLSFQIAHSSEWIKRGQTIYAESGFGQLGRAVSISKHGQTIAVAAPFAQESTGYVIILELKNGFFHQKGQPIFGVHIGDQSGDAIAISASGSMVAIGSRYCDGTVRDAGNVRVFGFDGTEWNQIGDAIMGEASLDYAGTSLGFSNDGLTVAVGAIGNDNGGAMHMAGQVRIFQFNGESWVQKGSSIYGEVSGDRSGYSLSMSGSGDTVAIGSDNSDIGQVRVFKYENEVWTKQGQSIEGKEASLSEDGLTVAVGSPMDDTVANNAGCVTMYTFSHDNWERMGQPIYGLAGDQIGNAISLSGNGRKIAIASHLHDKEGESNSDNGYLQIFRYFDNKWSQFGRTIYGGTSHGLGYSVGLSHRGDWVVVGAASYSNGYVRVYEYPTDPPSEAPSLIPTVGPSVSPSLGPSDQPTKPPTTNPTSSPTLASPSQSPSRFVSSIPTKDPTGLPSVSAPSLSPTNLPSKEPTENPRKESAQGLTDKPLADSISLKAEVDGADKSNKDEICDAFAESLVGKHTGCILVHSGRRQLQSSVLAMEISVPDASYAKSQIDYKDFIRSLHVPEGVVVYSVTYQHEINDTSEEVSESTDLAILVLGYLTALSIAVCLCWCYYQTCWRTVEHDHRFDEESPKNELSEMRNRAPTKKPRLRNIYNPSGEVVSRGGGEILGSWNAGS